MYTQYWVEPVEKLAFDEMLWSRNDHWEMRSQETYGRNGVVDP